MLQRVLVAVAVLDGCWALLSLGGVSLLTPVYWFYFLPLIAVILMKLLGSTRASDCVFDPDELRIEGGKYDGFHIGWSAIEPATSRLAEDGTLVLDLGSGVRVNVAIAQDPEEKRSLGTLLEAIRERKKPATEPARPAGRTHEAGVVVCAGCGAAAVVDDAEAVRCRFCGASVPVPADVRERVRAARALRRERASSDQLIERLLNQPSAGRVNRVLAGVAALGLLWLPLPLMTRSFPTALVTAGLVVLGSLAAHAIIVDRRAVRHLTLDFGARAAARAGEAERCRRCDAPLPPAVDDAIVVACAYCQAENILGVDPRGAEKYSRAAETDLAFALSQRRVAHVQARIVAALLGAAVCAGLVLVLAR
jgi:hypothetical protein